MNPARRLSRPSVGETVHVSLTRSELRRLTQRGVHLRQALTGSPAADPAAAEAVSRSLELERDLALRTAERDSLARRLEVLSAEKQADETRLLELQRELLERERRIASLHGQLVHWQHQARRAQQASRHAHARESAGTTTAASAPSLLDPLPRRVIAEIRESLERTAADPRPWLSPGRLTVTSRQRWIAVLAVLAVVAPVAALSRRAADQDAREVPERASRSEVRPGLARLHPVDRFDRVDAGPPLPPELVAHVPADVLGARGTRPPWLPLPLATPFETPRGVLADVAGPPLPPRAFGPPRFAARLASTVLLRAAFRASSHAPWVDPEDWTQLVATYPAASATQRRRIAQEMRADLGAGLGLVGWRSALAPGADGAPRELVAFPVVGADLALGPIGLWLWSGERHDPDAEVRALDETARTWSAHASADPPDVVPPAELLRAFAGIALRLRAAPDGPESRRLRRVPLHRETGAHDPDGAHLVVLVRRGTSDPARLQALGTRALEARGRETGRVAFHELAGLADARGWAERRVVTIDLSIRDGAPGTAAASPR